jgi:hypothetical protein
MREVHGLLGWSFNGGDWRLTSQASQKLQKWSSNDACNFVPNGVFAQHAAHDTLKDVALHETNASVESRPSPFDVSI